jgi:hypothetical protein
MLRSYRVSGAVIRLIVPRCSDLKVCLKTRPTPVAVDVRRLKYLGFPDRTPPTVRVSSRRLLLFKQALRSLDILFVYQALTAFEESIWNVTLGGGGMLSI